MISTSLRRQAMIGLQVCTALVTALLLASCSQQPKLAPLSSQATILAFGDSLTFGTGAPRGSGYPEALATSTGLRVINAGVPGETTPRGLARLPQLLAEHQPDLVVLIHGGNDILRNLPVAASRSNLQAMVAAAQTAGAQVVLLGVPGRSLTLSAPAWYQEVADAQAVPIDTDTLPALMRDRSIKADAVHFTAAGYQRLAEGVRKLLQDSGAMP